MNTEMNNRDRYFKGQLETEEIICFFRRHWIVLIKHISGFITVMLITMGIYFISLNLPGQITATEFKIMMIFAIIIFSFLIHRFFVELMNYFLSMTIVTSFRLIALKKTILFHDDKDVIDLHEIQDIQKIQDGLIPNILNYGKIKISLAGMTDIRIIYFVPRPDWYFRRINEAKRDYIIKRRQQKITNQEIDPASDEIRDKIESAVGKASGF